VSGTLLPTGGHTRDSAPPQGADGSLGFWAFPRRSIFENAMPYFDTLGRAADARPPTRRRLTSAARMRSAA
jgi:hypothetical protein